MNLEDLAAWITDAAAKGAVPVVTGRNGDMDTIGSATEVKRAVVDINTSAIETFDLAIASKKQYQCNPIKIPLPNSFANVVEDTLMF